LVRAHTSYGAHGPRKSAEQRLSRGDYVIVVVVLVVVIVVDDVDSRGNADVT
jgi:hypothetical protein